MKLTPLFVLLAVLSLAAGMFFADSVHRQAWADGYASVDGGAVPAAAPSAPVAAPLEMTAPDAPARATAPAPTALPDPVKDPQAEASLVMKLWRSGAIPSAVIVAAFALLALARAHLGWLKKGRQAVIAAALLGGLAMLAADAAAGHTPNVSMLMTSLMTAVALYWKTEHPSSAGA